MRGTEVRLLMVQQTQLPFGNVFVLDLERSAINRRRLAAQPASRAVQFGLGEALAVPAKALRTHDLHEKLRTILTDARAGVLHDGGRESRTGIAFGFRH